MSSRSLPATYSGQCRRSRQQPGRNTDPMNSAEKDCRSEGSETNSKRKSEESLERGSKRSRTSRSPSNSTSQTFSGPSTSLDTRYQKTNSKRKSPEDEGEERQRKRSRTSQSPSKRASQTFSGPSTSALVTKWRKTSSKRKSPEDEGEERQRKRSRTSQSPPKRASQTFSGPSTSALVTKWRKTSSKRKSTEDGSEERPRKRSKGTPSSSEDSNEQTTPEASTSNNPGTSSSQNVVPAGSRAAFEATYEEGEQLGRGGFGTVFAGHRKRDNLPVAIKHIPLKRVDYASMSMGGKTAIVPLELALLLKVRSIAAVVKVLDWYNLDQELILILERPVPCSNLIEYIDSREMYLQEHEAKALTKQLLDALIEVHSRGVFHRDIKPDNILIETGSDVPRVRLIDFGCGTVLSEETYTEKSGTYPYKPPEWFQCQWYKGEPTTVWQLGIVVFQMLHNCMPFDCSSEIRAKEPDIREDLSINCNSFLHLCLSKRLEARPTLQNLRSHPWLMTPEDP